MVPRLPTNQKLRALVQAPSTSRNSPIASSAYLASRASELRVHGSVEDLATSDASEAEGLIHHLTVVRAALARELWAHQLFIGVSVLDDLVFHAAASGETDLVGSVIEMIRRNRLDAPGFVLFPLHSFGVLAAGILHSFSNVRVSYMTTDLGLAITPQTNDFNQTMSFVENAASSFGIKKGAPRDLLEHWTRSRNTKWLTRNPLLAVRTNSFPGHYYENQFLLLGKLRVATTLLSMLESLQPSDKASPAKLFSSSMINNFQTLDIHHYMVFYDGPSRAKFLSGDCVPMNVSPAALSELSDLSIELDPRNWNRRRPQALRVDRALNRVYAGYLRHVVGKRKRSTAGRVYGKMFDSLAYFRRSFQRFGQTSPIINLAIAYEMLLTDHYAGGVSSRVTRRVQLLLRGTRGITAHCVAVESLFSARGSLVHSGAMTQTVDVEAVQRTFTLVFIRLVERLDAISQAPSSSPMGFLSGDLPPENPA